MEALLRNIFVAILQSESSENDNKYVAALQKEGIKADYVSTISFDFTNLDVLKNFLGHPNDYSGIILTSTRSVNAVCKALNSTPLDKEWQSKLCFSVGEATSKAALSQLNLQTIGSDSGNSANLCEVIIEKYRSTDKPLLFPCSNIRRNTIPDALSKHNIQLEEIICYETVSNPLFKQQWDELVDKEGLPNILVFFSPSGVKYCFDIVMKSYSSNIKPMILALGPSTEKALIENGIEQCKVAKKPNPESVVSAVKEMLNL